MTRGQSQTKILSLAGAFALLALGSPLEASMTGVAVGQSVSLSQVEALERDLEALRTDVDRMSASESRRQEIRSELAEIDDEIAYLRVMLRRNAEVSDRDVRGLRDRMSALRRELSGETSSTPADETVTIPVGTEVNVRLQTSLSSDTAIVEDRFVATLVDDLRVDGNLAVASGAEIRGVVSDVQRSSRTRRGASLTLAFDQLTADGRTYPVRLTLTEAQETSVRDEADRIGVGAGVGGVIGGLLGGFKGALTGILIGAGGTVAATEGEDVDLPAGTLLRVRFDSPLDVESR